MIIIDILEILGVIEMHIKKEEYLSLNALNVTKDNFEEHLDQVQFLLGLYKNIFNDIYNWIVVVDKEGFIVMMNKKYCDFIGIKQEEAIGRHVTEVIENTRMHIVLKTQQ